MHIKQLQKILQKRHLDVALIFSKDPSFFYFVQEESSGALLVFPFEEPLLCINKIEEVATKINTFFCSDYRVHLKQILLEKQIKKIGLNYFSESINTFNEFKLSYELTDISENLFFMRKTKNSYELSCIKKACKKTEQILSKIINNFTFKSEGEIKRFIKIEAIKNNCELSFEPIVASGANAQIPHYKKSTKLNKGFLIIDLGLKYKGYCSDITRTFYLGVPSVKEKQLYETILKIQKKIIKSIKPGIKTADLEKKARVMMKSDSKYFVHNLGHGLGVEIHELPRLNLKSDDILRTGMIITIEPGYYNTQGIRIEDDVLVTNNGAQLLTMFPKKLKVLSY
ncbi:MAG: Xaa-Pro peptidase family protein [Nanoarchaeota archaeon]|nr:Xaa-Pro peptidase family protein [Nanoarchaeota archaeon]MBU1030013.1 Xaa-Pro peptidase family protein [Nanoarchaeota archaeon]MBU1850394.1 Xaa-Pro peptidase family protein [Nanoarchaeota archaeon]